MDEIQKMMKAVDKIGADEGIFSVLTPEHEPEWFSNVVMRMARIVAPDLKKEDFEQRPEHFCGVFMALLFPLIKAAQEIDLSEIPDEPPFKLVKQQMEQIRGKEFAHAQEAVTVASSLPASQSEGFFSAFGEGLAKDASGYGMERFEDNNTALICLYLLLIRKFIVEKKVRSVTELYKHFMQLREALPNEKEYFTKNPDARASLEKQFRKICTEEGVKLRGRGRPPK